ncbi:MAG: L,D-transpeptidase family protein [Candidatus Saccharibacteria bacterium]|nr:L,D-transpeptidase family protein [Candidatus Saccharibacteria bacterium]
MRRIVVITSAAAVLAAGCTQTIEQGPESTLAPLPSTITYPETAPVTTIPQTTPETFAPAPVTSEAAPSTPPPTTQPLDVLRPECAILVQSGMYLSDISELSGVSITDLVTENGIADPDKIDEGDIIDVCINGIDDLDTGEPRVAPTTAPPTTAPAPESTAPLTIPPVELPSGVEAQQAQLNALFGPYGMPSLDVDGISGPLTDQQNCAAKLVLGLAPSRADIAPGSEEEKALMSATSLPLPQAEAVDEGKWAVIDQTCQVMFVGEDASLAFVFPVSTGRPEFPTRNDTRRAHRYDPALENNGWHDSTAYPATDDNPLNGNMYKPVYIDKGQAIHGANNVPPEPASHGCTRTRIGDQELFIAWLGLAGQTEQTFSLPDVVDLEVTVQGAY